MERLANVHLGPEHGSIQSGELKVNENSMLHRFEPVALRLSPRLSQWDSMSSNSTTGLLSKAHIVFLSLNENSTARYGMPRTRNHNAPCKI